MTAKLGSVILGVLLFSGFAFGQSAGQSGPRVGTASEGRTAPVVPSIPYYDDGVPPPIGRTDEDGFSASGVSPMGGGGLSDKAPKAPADPHNFEGAWNHREMLRDRIFRTILETRLPYNEEGRKVLKYRRESENSGKPILTNSGKCYPTTEFALEINGAMFIVQSEKFMHASFYEFHNDWQIRLNQKHITTGPRNFAGDSIGYWDGNTLVVETTRYREPIWLDPVGTPASENAVITRRIRKIENGQALEMLITVDDPKYYTKPWTYARTFAWRPDSWRVREYNCEQQVGGPNGPGYAQVKEQLPP
jgi:hypothetical protein